ncbi:454_t:CDS:2, partial [Acaulospora colombiana]
VMDADVPAFPVAKIAKDAGETIPLLAPLKAAMGIMITLLEVIKDVRKCEEDWETLSNHLANRIGLLQGYLANKPANVELQEMVAEYKGQVQVVRGIEPLARKHKTWYQSIIGVKSDEDKIQESIREMDEAFNTFTMKLQIQVQQGVSQIQVGQELIHEEVIAHRTDHAKSHARILEAHEVQKDMGNTKDCSEETILLNTLSAATFANGDEHDICLKETRVAILEEAR